MKYLFPTICLVLLASNSQAQLIGPVPSPVEPFSQNSIQNMSAFGDHVWIGPSMNYNVDGTDTWLIPAGADSITDGRGRLFSIALAQDTIFAGLGFNFEDDSGESIQTGMGFYSSVTGGQDWRFIDFPLDNPEHTSILYGGQELEALPVIVAQQSPPFDVDFKGDVVFFAGWASGIRRSMDFGETWQRILLPPSNQSLLTPEYNYDYIFNPLNDNNFLGFSVLIDQNGKVWAGTASGVNVSPNALTAPADSIIWNLYRHETGSRDGLLGNWVVNIKENPTDGSIWMTNWITEGGEQQGIVSTQNGGETFEQHLIGQRINDIEFDGQYIYAAGNDGLFISRNNGQTWENIPQIRSANTFIKPNSPYYSLGKTNDRLWVGTGDGMASTTDRGESWEISRVDFPLRGGNRYQTDAPNVDAYAYPNPFSPNNHDFVRIKFEVTESGPVTIRIFDFAMNLIRVVEDDLQVSQGTYEAAWDGLDQHGRKVANGPVFYQVNTGSKEHVGRILVLE